MHILLSFFAPFSTPLLAHYCFLVSYTYTMLRDGFHFESNRTITVRGKINNLKVGWALGAMLYEINALPWEYIKPYTWFRGFFGSFILNIILAVVMLFFLIKSHKSAVTIKRSRSTSGLPKSRSGLGYSSIPDSLNGSSSRSGSTSGAKYQPIPTPGSYNAGMSYPGL